MCSRSRFTDRSRSCTGLVCPFPGRPCPTGSLLPENVGFCRYITYCTRSFLQTRSCMRMRRRSWCCGSRSGRHGSAAMYGSIGHPAMLCGLLCFMITSRAELASARAGFWRAFRAICIRMGTRHIIAVCPKRYAASAAGRICGENLRIR